MCVFLALTKFVAFNFADLKHLWVTSLCFFVYHLNEESHSQAAACFLYISLLSVILSAFNYLLFPVECQCFIFVLF